MDERQNYATNLDFQTSPLTIPSTAASEIPNAESKAPEVNFPSVIPKYGTVEAAGTSAGDRDFDPVIKTAPQTAPLSSKDLVSLFRYKADWDFNFYFNYFDHEKDKSYLFGYPGSNNHSDISRSALEAHKQKRLEEGKTDNDPTIAHFRNNEMEDLVKKALKNVVKKYNEDESFKNRYPIYVIKNPKFRIDDLANLNPAAREETRAILKWKLNGLKRGDANSEEAEWEFVIVGEEIGIVIVEIKSHPKNGVESGISKKSAPDPKTGRVWNLPSPLFKGIDQLNSGLILPILADKILSNAENGFDFSDDSKYDETISFERKCKELQKAKGRLNEDRSRLEEAKKQLEGGNAQEPKLKSKVKRKKMDSETSTSIDDKKQELAKSEENLKADNARVEIDERRLKAEKEFLKTERSIAGDWKKEILELENKLTIRNILIIPDLESGLDEEDKRSLEDEFKVSFWFKEDLIELEKSNEVSQMIQNELEDKFLEFFEEKGRKLPKEYISIIAAIPAAVVTETASIRFDNGYFSPYARAVMGYHRMDLQNVRDGKKSKLSLCSELQKFDQIKGPTLQEIAKKRLLFYSQAQIDVLNETRGQQFLIGAAGTGKTLLIRIKAETELKKGKKVLIFSRKNYVPRYQSFFKDLADVPEENYTVLDNHDFDEKLVFRAFRLCAFNLIATEFISFIQENDHLSLIRLINHLITGQALEEDDKTRLITIARGRMNEKSLAFLENILYLDDVDSIVDIKRINFMSKILMDLKSSIKENIDKFQKDAEESWEKMNLCLKFQPIEQSFLQNELMEIAGKINVVFRWIDDYDCIFFDDSADGLLWRYYNITMFNAIRIIMKLQQLENEEKKNRNDNAVFWAAVDPCLTKWTSEEKYWEQTMNLIKHNGEFYSIHVLKDLMRNSVEIADNLPKLDCFPELVPRLGHNIRIGDVEEKQFHCESESVAFENLCAEISNVMGRIILDLGKIELDNDGDFRGVDSSDDVIRNFGRKIATKGVAIVICGDVLFVKVNQKFFKQNWNNFGSYKFKETSTSKEPLENCENLPIIASWDKVSSFEFPIVIYIDSGNTYKNPGLRTFPMRRDTFESIYHAYRAKTRATGCLRNFYIFDDWKS